MNFSDIDDAYDDRRQIRGAIVSDKISSMPRRPALVVAPDATVHDVVLQMDQKHEGCALVAVDGKLVGIFTERDLLKRVVADRLDTHRTTVNQVMTSDPDTLRLEDGIAYALNLMSVGGYRNIPIVDNEKHPLCIVSMKDIVEFIVELFPEGVLNLPPEPDLAIPRTRGGA